MTQKFHIQINPQVYFDIQNQVEYYYKVTKSHQLGKRFSETVGKAIKKLETDALHYEVKYDDIRCLPVSKFPYLAHFRVDESLKIVRVEAVISTSENPSKFSLRTKE